ncbi:MAG: phosphonate C-P lyase system protein PhnH [Caldilineaceae bacterium]
MRCVRPPPATTRRERRLSLLPACRRAEPVHYRTGAGGRHALPRHAATLVLGCTLGQGPEFRLKGPGITSSTLIRVDDLPDKFWDLRARSRRYPLGWDVFLVGGGEVIGIPRTTTVERMGG